MLLKFFHVKKQIYADSVASGTKPGLAANIYCSSKAEVDQTFAKGLLSIKSRQARILKTTMLILPEQILHKKAEKKILSLQGATLIDYRQDYTQPIYEVCMTQHLLAFILDGEKLIYVGEEVFRMKEGDAFFLRRGEYAMSEISPVAGTFSNVLFFLEPTLIDEFLGASHFPSTRQAPIFRITNTPLVRHFIENLPVFLADPLAGNTALVHHKLLELLHLLAESTENPGFKLFLQQLNRLERNDLLSFMNRHADTGFSVAELAELSGRSLATFKRDFLHLFGEPPGAWLRRRRLEKAHAMLCTGSKSVTEVCFDVGYGSLSHFIQAFRQRYGETPRNLSQKRQKLNRIA